MNPEPSPPQKEQRTEALSKPPQNEGDKICVGCGAKIQTEEPKRIGYVPPDKLHGPAIDIPASLDNEALRAILAYKPSTSPEANVKCQRCWKLEHYGIVVPVEVTAAELLKELKVA